MVIRADKRTLERIKGEFRGYPIAERYKNLGIEIDNDLTLQRKRKP